MFKKIVKCYEQKQYKNGLKFAKQILSSHPEHGETLSMKGLILSCMGKKEEAYEFVRKGLRNNLRSHVCWHVYGILQRSDKKYDEAIKCYRNALKWDKDNIHILRDLSHLQIQMRDLEGYRETRYQLFVLRPTQRVSWIGYAMAQHLAGDYDMALSILDSFREKLSKDSADYERSEVLLYQNMVMREAGRAEDALQHLSKYEKQICDKLAVAEIRGELYLQLNKKSRALSIYDSLLQRNPENRDYFAAAERCHAPASRADRVRLYQNYSQRFPRAHTPRKLQLYLGPEELSTVGDELLRKGLRKGAPPLFTDMRSVYERVGESAVLEFERLMLQYEQCLQQYGSFDPPSVSDDGESSSADRESPSCLLWTYFYLAQHFDYRGDIARALDYIDRALEHTPTLIELYVFKGKLFKHAGNPVEAYRWLNESQAMDTADRYINSKAAKYMLRANMLEEAEQLCAKFTREGVRASEDLNNMQCMWFLTESALAYHRLQNWGEALKKCHEVDRHFSDIVEDQFDFNTYCLRRMTIRPYVNLLRLEDTLRRHPFYFTAAKCAIEVYLHLYDMPVQQSSQQTNHTENLSEEEMKKTRSQMRKARKKERQLQEQKEQEELKKQHNQHNHKKEDGDEVKHESLDANKLAETDKPLEEADRFLQPLLQLAPDNVHTHLMAFEIYSRKEKTLLMLRALKQALRISSNEAASTVAPPLLHGPTVRMLLHLQRRRDQMTEPLLSVVEHCSGQLFDGQTAEQLNHSWIRLHAGSLPHVLQGAEMMYYLDKSKDVTAVSLLTDLTQFPDCTWQECHTVWKALDSGRLGSAGTTAAPTFQEECAQRFPYCTLLGGSLPPPSPMLDDPSASLCQNMSSLDIN